MFWTYFTSSLKALAWLILLPVVLSILFFLFIEPYVIDELVYSDKDFTWTVFLVSMCISIGANFFFLMIIPAAIGGINPSAKKTQFYLGFFTNVILALVLTIIYKIYFTMDVGFFFLTLGLHCLGFIVTFVLGARCVAPSYARAFWFMDRNKDK